MTRRTAPLAVVAFMLGGLAGCGSPEQASPDEPVTITVFAAASLTGTFQEIGRQFESENDVTVRFSFAGSSDLAAQIQSGAPADVFASADEPSMGKITAPDLNAGEPEIFATNTLTIAVPNDNPAGIDGLDDLADDDLDVIVCAPEVPCGAAANKVEEAAGVDIKPASEEQNVTDVLNKVATGEADAGLVYVTDIARADDVTAVDFPEASSAANAYPIAALKGGRQAEVAQDFVDHVLGDAGQGVLADAGFGPPSP